VNAYAPGSVVTSIPSNCPFRTVNGADYYVCADKWFQPLGGAGGPAYRVIDPAAM
jgi:hypothetical protein